MTIEEIVHGESKNVEFKVTLPSWHPTLLCCEISVLTLLKAMDFLHQSFRCLMICFG